MMYDYEKIRENVQLIVTVFNGNFLLCNFKYFLATVPAKNNGNH